MARCEVAAATACAASSATSTRMATRRTRIGKERLSDLTLRSIHHAGERGKRNHFEVPAPAPQNINPMKQDDVGSRAVTIRRATTADKAVLGTLGARLVQEH